MRSGSGKPKIVLMKTDQVDCFDVDGRVITCQGSGQDGELGTGGLWSQERFEAGSGTVNDRISGLMWAGDGSPGGFPMTWREAQQYLLELNRAGYLGHRDWRLPARSELFSMVSHARTNPALPDEAPFENVFPGYYWTSSTCSGFEDQAWYLHLGGARVFRGMKHGSYMVWPVRSARTCEERSADNGKSVCRQGQRRHRCKPVSIDLSASGNQKRFLSRANRIHDRRTGLIWLKTADFHRGAVTWPEALERMRDLNAEQPTGRSDWRLPNIRELESLVDVSRHHPALADDHPFGSVPDGCWSSTTSVYEPRYAWVVYWQDGSVGVGYKRHATFDAWAVRGGPAPERP
jgi:hypothetical protein